MEKNLNKSRTYDIVETGLMAAVIFIVTWVFHLPSHFGTVHLGDGMVLLSAAILSRKKAVAASGISMFLFDVVSGYMIWSPFTLVIKGVMAYLASVLYEKHKNIFAFIPAVLWMIAGYYLTGAIIYKFFTSTESYTFIRGLQASLLDIPTNIVQGAAGLIIAALFIKALEKIKVKRG
ncbi:MAG: ECF transporter S component [Bacillota bacterium]|nr:ECF transporter S component [Bacillota bacterium]